MRLILFTVFLIVSLIGAKKCNAQTGTFIWTNGAPTTNPGASGARFAVDRATFRWYEWVSGTTWVGSGDRIQQISGCSAPNYTPGIHNSRIVINSCAQPEIYIWNGSAWTKPPSGEGSDYVAGVGISIDTSTTTPTISAPTPKLFLPYVADIGIVPNAIFATPEISNDKYLLVSGAIGATSLTVTGGNTGDFAANIETVVYASSIGRYKSIYLRTYNGASATIDYPLQYVLANDTLRVTQDATNGQHLTDFGSRALADELFDTKRYTTERTNYIAKFTPESEFGNSSIPFQLYGGAALSGFVQGSSSTLFNTSMITNENQDYSRHYTYGYTFQQGGAAGIGTKWVINSGQEKGFLSATIGVKKTAFGSGGSAKVILYDEDKNEIIGQQIIYGAFREVVFPFEFRNRLSIRVETNTSDPTTIVIANVRWNIRESNTEDYLLKDFNRVVLWGDSWTVRGDSSLHKRLDFRLKELNPNAFCVTKGRGGMTIRWGGRYIRSEVIPLKPDLVISDFRINDLGSISSPSSAYNFSSTGAYADGTDINGNLGSISEYKDSIAAMFAVLKSANSSLVLTQDHYVASLGQNQTQQQTIAENVTLSTPAYGAELTLPRHIIADTVTIKSSMIFGKAGISSVPSIQLNVSDVDAGNAKSVLIKPTITKSGGNAFVIEPLSSTSSLFNIDWNGFVYGQVFESKWPFSSGGFLQNGFRFETSGTIARLKADAPLTVARMEIGENVIDEIRMLRPIRNTVLSGATNRILFADTDGTYTASSIDPANVVTTSTRQFATVWTTSTRPTPSVGEYPMGFNTTTGKHEGWNGTTWNSFY